MDLTDIRTHIKEKITNEQLLNILFDMGRYFDKDFTEKLSQYQNNSRKFNTYERGLIRKYYYYGIKKYIAGLNVIDFHQIKYNEDDVKYILNDFNNRILKYNDERIYGSIKKRIQDVYHSDTVVDNSSQWLDFYYKKNQKYKFGGLIIKIDQKTFDEINQDENIILGYIKGKYNELQNYRYINIVFEGNILKNKVDFTWDLIQKIAIFCENMESYKEKYAAFHPQRQIASLQEFLNTRIPNLSDKIAENYYGGISYGFKYEDCLVSDNQHIKILIMKKVELDNTNILCPSCLTTIQRGNSYPSMFLKSWECANPSCPDRSKSGRGKRFDEHGTFRNFKLMEDQENNLIDLNTYKNWQRDVFKQGTDWLEMLLLYNTWADDTVYVVNVEINGYFKGRTIVHDTINDQKEGQLFAELPIVKLFTSISKNLDNKTGSILLKHDIELVNDKSEDFLRKLSKNQIGSAITSPPYYNAREYSQWSNLVLYLIDMMINAKSIHDSLIKDGHYLYNIGDIVSADNIYVRSNMSNRRLMLGFYSIMIFKLVGFNFVGNIIWDKGAVQSKRNSTVNLNSGYVKYVNCYEHILVFKKGQSNEIINQVFVQTPVIKINSKGENLAKHTAPYPMELVNLIKVYSNKNYYILDPYLGSGTTLKWCKHNKFKGLGIELNKDYFELAKQNLGLTED